MSQDQPSKDASERELGHSSPTELQPHQLLWVLAQPGEGKEGVVSLPSGTLSWSADGVELQAPGGGQSPEQSEIMTQTGAPSWRWQEGEALALSLSRWVQPQRQGWLSRALGQLPQPQHLLLCQLRRSDGSALRLCCPAEPAWLEGLPHLAITGEAIEAEKLVDLLRTLRGLGVEAACSPSAPPRTAEHRFVTRAFAPLVPALIMFGGGPLLLVISGYGRYEKLIIPFVLVMLPLLSMLIALRSVRLLRRPGLQLPLVKPNKAPDALQPMDTDNDASSAASGGVVIVKPWPFVRARFLPLSAFASLQLRWERGNATKPADGDTKLLSQLVLASGDKAVESVPIVSQSMPWEQTRSSAAELASSLGLPLSEAERRGIRYTFPWLAYLSLALLLFLGGTVLSSRLGSDARWVLGGFFSGHASFVNTLTGTLFGNYALFDGAKSVEHVALGNEFSVALTATDEEVILWRLPKQRERWRLPEAERELLAAGQPDASVRWLGFSHNDEHFYIAYGNVVGTWQLRGHELLELSAPVLPSLEPLLGCAVNEQSTLLAWIDTSAERDAAAPTAPRTAVEHREIRHLQLLDLEAAGTAPLSLALPQGASARRVITFATDCSSLLIELEPSRLQGSESGPTLARLALYDTGSKRFDIFDFDERTLGWNLNPISSYAFAVSPSSTQLAFMQQSSIAVLTLRPPQQTLVLDEPCSGSSDQRGGLVFGRENTLIALCPTRHVGLLRGAYPAGVQLHFYDLHQLHTQTGKGSIPLALFKTVTGHGAAVFAYAVRRDGEQLITGSADGTAAVWRLP